MEEPKVHGEELRLIFVCSAIELVLYSEVSGNPLKALRQKMA